MKYSIIIPTYNKLEETLKPCMKSLLEYTDLTETEIIIVVNGCVDGTVDYVKDLGFKYENIFLLISEEALGYTKAVNEGIKISKGDYVILLNNDLVFLDQPKDTWKQLLLDPFLQDPLVGITGPMKEMSESAGRKFLLFFCVMIKRRVFNMIGILDEVFSPGYGEDTDFCLRAEDVGFKIVQVPEEGDHYYADKRKVGNFPLYHAGNQTFKDYPDADLIHRNNETLRKKYNINLENAKLCDGFMCDSELEWLAKESKTSNVVIEIGSWHGKSTRAIGDNVKGAVIAVDHWNGSEAETGTHHSSAKLMNGDHAYDEFMRNNIDLVLGSKVFPIRMGSINAAKLLQDKGIVADMVFIDAGHTYDEVIKDINAWLPLVKEGGILCGHDYIQVDFMQVYEAVNDTLGFVEHIDNTSIWKHIKKTVDRNMPCIYDCFMFNNEFDILEKRLETLYDTVDRFVIVEATRTHGNKDKALNFHNNLGRYEKYLNKITYIVVEDFPATDSWSIERHQRDAIMRGLKGCIDDDIIMISDCDEIPNPDKVKGFRYMIDFSIKALEMDLFYYNEHIKAEDKWSEAKLLTYKELKGLTPCGARYKKCDVIHDAGWHYSYFGGADTIVKKLEDTAHQEYNNDTYKDKSRILQAIQEGKDLFDRDLKFDRV